MTRFAAPLFLIASLAGCQTMTSTPNPGEMEAVELARFDTFVKADTAAMKTVLGDDLLYCHSSGKCQTKPEIIAAFASKEIVYKKLTLIDMKPRAFGGAVLVNGKVEITVDQSGQLTTFQAVYTDVYARRHGRWELVSWQSTRSP